MKNLFRIFLWIVGIKVLLSFFVQGIIIAPDESCVIKSAQYLANNFEYKDCSELINMDAGDAPIVPVVVYSVFYFLFSSFWAFKASLVFNAVLAASLVFPFYGIAKSFLESEKRSLYLAVAMTFVPSIFLYEKSLMTEIIFAATNVWAVYFYIQSFEKKRTRNKLLAFCLAFLAIFMRPYGFITIVALQMNELFGSGKGRRLLKLALMAMVVIFVGYFLKDRILHQLGGLHVFAVLIGFWATFVRLVQSFVTTLNTLSISTLVLPLAVLIFTRGREIKNIRVFLLTFVFLNIGILMPRLFIDSSYPNITYTSLSQYFEVPDTLFGLGRDKIIFKPLFRYFNVSTILLMLFGAISILKVEKERISKWAYAVMAMLVGALFFTNFGEASFHLVISHSYLLLSELHFVFYVLIAVALSMCYFLVKRKGEMALVTMFVSLMVISLISFEYNVIRSFYRAPPSDGLAQNMEEGDVVFLMNRLDMKDASYWASHTMLDNRMDTFFYDQDKVEEGDLPETFRVISTVGGIFEKVDLDFDQYDFIVSKLDLDYEKIYEGDLYTIYGL